MNGIQQGPLALQMYDSLKPLRLRGVRVADNPNLRILVVVVVWQYEGLVRREEGSPNVSVLGNQ